MELEINKWGERIVIKQELSSIVIFTSDIPKLIERLKTLGGL